MTVAPRRRAAAMLDAHSSISAAAPSEHGPGGASGSIRIASARERLPRSERGYTFSLPRSSGSTPMILTAPSAPQQVIDEGDGLAEVGDHGVGADAEQS